MSHQLGGIGEPCAALAGVLRVFGESLDSLGLCAWPRAGPQLQGLPTPPSQEDTWLLLPTPLGPQLSPVGPCHHPRLLAEHLTLPFPSKLQQLPLVTLVGGFITDSRHFIPKPVPSSPREVPCQWGPAQTPVSVCLSPAPMTGPNEKKNTHNP